MFAYEEQTKHCTIKSNSTSTPYDFDYTFTVFPKSELLGDAEIPEGPRMKLQHASEYKLGPHIIRGTENKCIRNQ